MEIVNFENAEIIYDYNPVLYDDYLKSLTISCLLDKDIMINSLPNLFRITRYNKVKNSIKFFDDINLKLHKVSMLMSDRSIEKINPIYIPIEKTPFNSFSYEKDIYIKEEENILNVHISIGLKTNDEALLIPSYLHELTHTQVNSYINNNQIKDDSLDEFLPIFIEQLYCGLNNNNKMLYWRIKTLLKSIKTLKEQQLFGTMYIKSTLEALNLKSLYFNSNIEIQKEIINNVQRVFNAEMYLDDLLEYFDINYDNSKKELKVLKQVK